MNSIHRTVRYQISLEDFVSSNECLNEQVAHVTEVNVRINNILFES